MYDIDRALRRLELAHRLEELDKARTDTGAVDRIAAIPAPTPVPPTSAPTEVITDVSDPADDAATPRTLPNGLPVRTPGTRFRTQQPSDGRDASGTRVVIPLGEPLPPVGSAETAHRLLARANPLAPPAPLPATAAWESRSGWAADHDVPGTPTPPASLPASLPASPLLSPEPPAAAPAMREAAVPGEPATQPGQLPVSELLAGLLTPPPSGPIARSPRGAFTPVVGLPGAVMPPAIVDDLPEQLPVLGGVGDAGFGGSEPQPTPELSTAEPSTAEPPTAEPPAAESSAAERIAAMLRGGAPGLLA